MSQHQWEPDPRYGKPRNGKTHWRCAKCDALVTCEKGELPDPEAEYWTGHESKTEGCDEMVVARVMDS